MFEMALVPTSNSVYLLVALTLAVASSCSTYAANSSSCSGEVFHQHQDYASYNQVAINRQGYFSASSSYLFPQMVENYHINGSKIVKKSYVSETIVNRVFSRVALARNSTFCVGVMSYLYSDVREAYIWDLARPNPDPLYTMRASNASATKVDIARDGSFFLLADARNPDDRPDKKFWEVAMFRTSDGKLLTKYRTRGGSDHFIVDAGLSGDGLYAAWVTEIWESYYQSYYNLTVTEYNPSEGAFGPRGVTALDVYVTSFKVSHSARFIAVEAGSSGSTKLVVYRRVSANNLEYARHNLGYGSPGGYMTAMAFSPEGLFLATAWYDTKLNLNQVVVYDLHSGKEVFRYRYPVDKYGDDFIISVALSEHGEYVVVGSSGTQNKQPGTQQVQVLKIGEEMPIFKRFIPGPAFSVDIMKTDSGKLYVVVGGGKYIPGSSVRGKSGDLFVYEVDV